LFGGLQDLYSALESAGEGALASAAGVYLGFEDEVAVLDVEVAGDVEGLFGGGGNGSALDENAVLAHEVFALVLVEVEETAEGGGEGFGEEGS
jgi:hypothetical protein